MLRDMTAFVVWVESNAVARRTVDSAAKGFGYGTAGRVRRRNRSRWRKGGRKLDDKSAFLPPGLHVGEYGLS